MQRVFSEAKLVKFPSSNGRVLNGLLYSKSQNPNKIVIHIHGSFGNFYHNDFIHFFAEKLNKRNVAVLTFNLTNHDGLSEGFFVDGRFEYVGGSVSNFDEALSDIEGAICFVKSLYQNIEVILQGHSLGCDRIIHYLIKEKKVLRFSLFSPCDSYELYNRWIGNKVVDVEINNVLKNYRTGQWLNEYEYGVKNNGEEYVLPMKKETFESIVFSAPFYYLNLNLNPNFVMQADCFICVCGKDPLQTYNSKEWFIYLEEHFPKSKKLFVENGDHDLNPCYDEIYLHYEKWILNDYK